MTHHKNELTAWKHVNYAFNLSQRMKQQFDVNRMPDRLNWCIWSRLWLSAAIVVLIIVSIGSCVWPIRMRCAERKPEKRNGADKGCEIRELNGPLFFFQLWPLQRQNTTKSQNTTPIISIYHFKPFSMAIKDFCMDTEQNVISHIRPTTFLSPILIKTIKRLFLF